MRSIRSKLILSYLAIALLTALLIYVLIRYTSNNRLKTLIIEQQTALIVDEVATWYAAEGTWNDFGAYFAQLHPQRPPPRPNDERANPPPRPADTGDSPNPLPARPPDRAGAFGVIDVNSRALIPTAGVRSGDIVPEGLLHNRVPVVVDGATVAYVVPTAADSITLAVEEELYLQRTDRVLLTAGVAGIGAALLMGLALARVLIRPIQDLTQASRAMTAGQLDQRVIVRSNDELGELATAFNTMSQDLAEATRQRRQMTADIAHDLGTPLQVISGYVEAAQEGALALTPKRIGTISAEINHLRRLINDLDLLAQTDTQTLSLQMEKVDTTDFLRQIESSFTPLAQAKAVRLLAEIPARLSPIQADYERLMQVMGNLLNNALRYTPTDGSITVRAAQQAGGVLLQVQDSGSGISAADLPFIFDRFYRADTARTEGGKMGLGLAISKALVEAMGGKISAESTPSVGTTFSIFLKTITS